MVVQPRWFVVVIGVGAIVSTAVSRAMAEDLSAWRSRLTFHASFDGSADADVAAGNAMALQASDLSRTEVTSGLPAHVQLASDGKWGQCLQFLDTSKQLMFYRGADNVPYDADGFSMTVAFWMRLNPDQDLKPGYVDPLQITDKKWNDASLFVDFTKDDSPRHFRLGLFSDYKFWNPQGLGWEQVAASDRPLVTVQQPPFSRDHWTHVAITLDRINAEDSVAQLYLDGRSQGQLQRRQQLTWSPPQLALMLGIQYIGRLDDLGIFRGAMPAPVIQQLMTLEGGIKMIGDAN